MKTLDERPLKGKTIITQRTEGMQFEQYKRLLKEQRKTIRDYRTRGEFKPVHNGLYTQSMTIPVDQYIFHNKKLRRNQK
jgi:hypothetical protein